jgi:hypothetical protein
VWNGEANTADPVLPAGEWAGQRRVHQFAGNMPQSYGGDAISIDQDYLSVDEPASGRAPA